MRTSQLVSNFRANYALFSDDIKWTDRFIISMFNIIRPKLLYDRNKKDRVKRTNFVGFCMPLCIGKPLECPCIAEAQCYALVSKYYVPDYIPLDYPYSGIEIRTGGGAKLDEWSPRDANLSGLNPALENKMGYWLENYRGKTKLVIWNTLDLEYVYVTMLPSDLDDILKLAQCGIEDGFDTCAEDWTTEEFPLDANLLFDLFRMTADLINQKYRDVDDDNNDTSDKLEN